jgi:hypothetical protein
VRAAACKLNPYASARSSIVVALDEGVHVVAGHNPESAKLGRADQTRTMSV